MLLSSPYIIVEELKHRTLLVVLSLSITNLILIGIGNPLLEQYIILNNLFTSKTQYLPLLLSIYENQNYSKVKILSQFTLFYYYPEQEFTFNLNDIYKYYYYYNTILLIVFLFPLIIYHVYLFFKPAIYSHEKLIIKLFIFFFIISLTFSLLESYKLTNSILNLNSDSNLSNYNDFYSVHYDYTSLITFQITTFKSLVLIKFFIGLFVLVVYYLSDYSVMKFITVFRLFPVLLSFHLFENHSFAFISFISISLVVIYELAIIIKMIANS